MKLQAIVDTGPLVAALSEADKYHTWVIQQIASHSPSS
jgi:predicted nucleic acid-binding protein